MSWSVFVMLECDAPRDDDPTRKCLQWWQGSEPGPLVRPARAAARRDGWVVRNEMDLCPVHAARQPASAVES